MEEYKKFEALNISSKFAICGLPIRMDSYKNCSFGCTYCFSNNRKICEFDKNSDCKSIFCRKAIRQSSRKKEIQA